MIARVFFWGSVSVAALAFVVALVVGATWAARFRQVAEDDERYYALREEAVTELERGNLAGAKRLTERVLAIDPEDPIARANLGRIYRQQGDYARAIAEHKLAIAIDPGLPDAYYNIACYYALMKRRDDAIAWLAAALDQGFGRRELLVTDPDLESVRGDPRFAILLTAGRLPTGIPRVRVHAPREAEPNGTFELVAVVERDVPPAGAAEAAASLSVEWQPEAPFEVLSARHETSATPREGVVALKTVARWKVKAGGEGIYSLPPVKASAAGKVVESESLLVEVGEAG